MAKLIPLDEAASILGISSDELTELRSNNEVFGYRDGSSWKFKLSELERLAADRGITLNLSADTKSKSAESDLDMSIFDISDSADDLSLSDDSLPRPGSNLVDDDNLIQPADDLILDDDSSSSELIGADASEIMLEDDSAEINLADSGELLLESSDDVLSGEDVLSFGESDLSLAASKSKRLSGSDTGDLLDDDTPKGDSPSDTGKMGKAGGADDLLSEDDLFSDELLLSEEGSMADSSELSSDFEDSDLIMDDSDSSTEIELSAPIGAGTDLDLSASESGISIDDEPLELGGSDIDSLELPEDDDMIMLDDPADPDSATIMQEDSFNLAPLDIEPEDESAGSQVIALEDSEIYADESAQTVLGASDSFEPAQPMLDDTADLGAYGGAAVGIAGVGAAAGLGAGAPVQSAVPEAPYNLLNILALGSTLVLLILGGAVAYDVARNIWQADSVLNSGILNLFLEMTGMDKMG